MTSTVTKENSNVGTFFYTKAIIRTVFNSGNSFYLILTGKMPKTMLSNENATVPPINRRAKTNSKSTSKRCDESFLLKGKSKNGATKSGAYYANWQLFGGTQKGFKAKEFFDKALEGSDVPAKAAQKITNFVQKRIKQHLR